MIKAVRRTRLAEHHVDTKRRFTQAIKKELEAVFLGHSASELMSSDFMIGEINSGQFGLKGPVLDGKTDAKPPVLENNQLNRADARLRELVNPVQKQERIADIIHKVVTLMTQRRSAKPISVGHCACNDTAVDACQSFESKVLILRAPQAGVVPQSLNDFYAEEDIGAENGRTLRLALRPAAYAQIMFKGFVTVHDLGWMVRKLRATALNDTLFVEHIPGTDNIVGIVTGGLLRVVV